MQSEVEANSAEKGETVVAAADEAVAEGAQVVDNAIVHEKENEIAVESHTATTEVVAENDVETAVEAA